MDVPLESTTSALPCSGPNVSILVLMDVPLESEHSILKDLFAPVSILVLMDVPLESKFNSLFTFGVWFQSLF